MASKRRRTPSQTQDTISPRGAKLLAVHRPASGDADIESQASSLQRTYGDYTIAWICALPIELETSRLMLDEVHGQLIALRGDDNSYVFGRIAHNNVVMTVLPGAYGKVKATRVAQNLQRSFPNIQATLVVGVGGGAPARADVRLGDVVVGIRVMEYDLGRFLGQNDFRATTTPNIPSSMLMGAISNLRSIHCTSHKGEQWSPRVQELLDTTLSAYSRPSQPDLLFKATYRHLEGADTCEKCDRSNLQTREVREHADKSLFHYGVIGSGDKVKKDALERDKVAGIHDLLCFEMEAAGVIETTGCLPIRGICDYSDSHKNKMWQPHAAASAAAYAKDFVESLSPLSATGGQQPVVGQDTTVKDGALSLALLGFPEMNDRREAIHGELPNTCLWVLEHSKYLQWACPDEQGSLGHEFLWMRGKAGTGKSTMMNFLLAKSKLLAKQRKTGGTVVSFFFNARSPQYLEKSTQGMYRSLLVQILLAIPDLQWLLHDWDARQLRLNSLKTLFRNVVTNLGDYSLTCLIDALDECDEQEITDMVSFFEDLAELASEKGTRFRILLSSRPYPYIKVAEERLINLEDEEGHANDLDRYVRKRLNVSQVVGAKLHDEILKKASGIFMWVVLVVGILNEEAKNRGGWALQKRLSELPSDLSQLFKEIITRDAARLDQLRSCILWILCSLRPLTENEFRFAMWASALHRGEVLDDGLPSLDDKEMNLSIVASCSKGLVEIIRTKNNKSTTVQFIHESVRDFLLKEHGLQELWPELGVAWEVQGHDHLRNVCEAYLIHPFIAKLIEGYDTYYEAKDVSFFTDLVIKHSSDTPSLEMALKNAYPFLEYATQKILRHAENAQLSIDQSDFVSRFFATRFHATLNCCRPAKATRHRQGLSQSAVMVKEDLYELVRASLREHAPNGRCISSGDRKDLNAFVGDALRDLVSFAIRKDDKEMMVVLLDPSPKLKARLDLFKGSNYFSPWDPVDPVQWAAKGGNVILLNLLARRGITPRVCHDNTYTSAACGGHLAAVKFLVQHGVRFSNWALHLAIERGHTSTARFLVDSDTTFGEGKALQEAAHKGHTKTVQFLIGCTANRGSREYRRAILEALRAGYEDTAMALFEHFTGWSKASEKDIDGWMASATRHQFEDALSTIQRNRANPVASSGHT